MIRKIMTTLAGILYGIFALIFVAEFGSEVGAQLRLPEHCSDIYAWSDKHPVFYLLIVMAIVFECGAILFLPYAYWFAKRK